MSKLLKFDWLCPNYLTVSQFLSFLRDSLSIFVLCVKFYHRFVLVFSYYLTHISILLKSACILHVCHVNFSIVLFKNHFQNLFPHLFLCCVWLIFLVNVLCSRLYLILFYCVFFYFTFLFDSSLLDHFVYLDSFWSIRIQYQDQASVQLVIWFIRFTWLLFHQTYLNYAVWLVSIKYVFIFVFAIYVTRLEFILLSFFIFFSLVFLYRKIKPHT